MKKFYALLLGILALLAFTVQGSASDRMYNLTVSAIFQNEGPYLKEWIEYHDMLGVDHFWLYNNESTDNFREVLEPYIESGLVELIEWPTTPFLNFHRCQVAAYNDSMQRGLTASRWVTCIDIDEFIVPLHTDNILDFLANYEEYAGVRINWQVFGTSFLPEIPAGKTLIESLLLKAPVQYRENRFVKLIVKPTLISKFYLHSAQAISGEKIVFLNGKAKRKPAIQVEDIQINHYWTRAEDFFFGVKLARGERIRYTTYSDQKIAEILNVYNSLPDYNIQRFVPELRRRLHLD